MLSPLYKIKKVLPVRTEGNQTVQSGSREAGSEVAIVPVEQVFNTCLKCQYFIEFIACSPVSGEPGRHAICGSILSVILAIRVVISDLFPSVIDHIHFEAQTFSGEGQTGFAEYRRNVIKRFFCAIIFFETSVRIRHGIIPARGFTEVDLQPSIESVSEGLVDITVRIHCYLCAIVQDRTLTHELRGRGCDRIAEQGIEHAEFNM